MDKIKSISLEYLQQTNFNYVKVEYESLKFEIDYEILAEFKKLNIGYYIQWYLNGNRIGKSAKIIFNENYIVINDLKHEDSGIYYCVIELEKFSNETTYSNLVRYHSDKLIIIGVYTVVVVGKRTELISNLDIGDNLSCNEKYLEFLVKNKKYELKR